jgi:hypothetical protein
MTRLISNPLGGSLIGIASFIFESEWWTDLRVVAWADRLRSTTLAGGPEFNRSEADELGLR